MSYWDETDNFMRRNGGAPNCPTCGAKMVPEDDHGRFRCFRCSYGHDVVTGRSSATRRITQVDTKSKAEKGGCSNEKDDT
jgi:hypothetical protein